MLQLTLQKNHNIITTEEYEYEKENNRKLQYQIGHFFEIEFERLGFLCLDQPLYNEWGGAAA